MTKYAIIKNGIVTQIFEGKDDDSRDWEDYYSKVTNGTAKVALDNVGVGWLYENMKFINPTSVISEEEIQAQKERDAEDEARQIAIEEIIAERTQQALDNVKNEIALGKIENARKAVRDEHKKLKG